VNARLQHKIPHQNAANQVAHFHPIQDKPTRKNPEGNRKIQQRQRLAAARVSFHFQKNPK